MYNENNYLRIYKETIVIGCLLSLLAFLIFIIVCIPSVSAAQTLNSSVNVSQITKNSITFEVIYKGSVRATGATFDGVEIENFDLQHNLNYTASDLEPNTTHQFCIYKDLYNCEIATTLSDNVDYNLEYYIALIIGIICIIVAAKYNRFVGFIGLMFGAYITMLSFSDMQIITLLSGIIIAIASCISIFWGNGE